MTPTTYGRDFAYCLKSHGGVRGFNASLWRFLLRCTLFCHSVATFLTSVSSYEGGCGFEVKKMTEQSPFLSGLNAEKQFADRMEKSLRSNKVLQRVLENPETRGAFVNAISAILDDLKNNEKSNPANE